VALTYFKDTHMSRPPGSLIATNQTVNFIFGFCYISSWPGLNSYFQSNTGYLCSVSSFIVVYALTCGWLYYFCINIELHIKVKKPNSRAYHINPCVYHAICQTLGLVTALYYTLDSEATWVIDQGCSVTFDSSSSFFVLGINYFIAMACGILSAATLYLMWKARQFTNYFVVHTIWTEIVVLGSLFELVFGGLLPPSCIGEDVNMLLPGISGMIVFSSRIIDPDFKKAFFNLFSSKKLQETSIDSLLSFQEQASTLSRDFLSRASKVESETYRNVFENLHLKFVLDSLITLTFYHTRASFENCQGVTMRNGVNENIYTIDAEFIKEVVQVDRFNSFFDKFTAFKYTLIEYSPQLFKQLRNAAGLSEVELMQSLNPFDNLKNLDQLSKAKGGSSGAFIYLTHDKRFLIKTITVEEKLVLLNTLLPGYLERLFSSDSALVRILGVFLIQCVGNYSTNVVLMENVSSCEEKLSVFDLKGSLHARKSKVSSQLDVKKDCNFIDELGTIDLRPDEAAKLLSRLNRDVEMLSSLNIMDYSLLVTICKGDVPSFINPGYVYQGNHKNEFYLIALIDVLQIYNFSKKAETFWKTKVKRVNLRELSSVESKMYAQRFLNFAAQVMRSSLNIST